MNRLLKPILVLAFTFASGLSFAGPLPVFSGWTVFGSEDQTGTGNYKLTPGWGGQKFDAEYLFYKLQGNNLSIGLQTGFDVISNNGQVYDNYHYYTGDLALSFDGNNSNYEYAIDFGNLTKNYAGTKKINAQSNNTSGVDTAGLYEAKSWNNDIWAYNKYGLSAPYGVSSGSLLLAANDDNFSQGSAANGYKSDISYFTMFTFDLSNITGLQPNFVLDAHWTMSCGNDAIDGRVTLAKVPEPSPILLFVLGLVGLVIARRKLK